MRISALLCGVASIFLAIAFLAHGAGSDITVQQAILVGAVMVSAFICLSNIEK